MAWMDDDAARRVIEQVEQEARRAAGVAAVYWSVLARTLRRDLLGDGGEPPRDGQP